MYTIIHKNVITGMLLNLVIPKYHDLAVSHSSMLFALGFGLNE